MCAMTLSSSDFIKEWFSHPTWWFDASPEDDKYLTKTYGHLLRTSEQDQCPKTDYVIIHDQLARHVYRKHPDKDVLIAHHLKQALLKRDQIPPNEMAELPDDIWCFMMLPVRHTNCAKRILNEVLQPAWGRLRLRSPMEAHGSLLRRFIKATYQRCPTEDQHVFLRCIKEKSGDGWDIHRFSHTLYFKPDQGPKECKHMHMVVKAVEDALRSAKPEKLILSLSGGVDSMVCLHILHCLQPRYRYKIDVVHINYTNRPTAYDEEAFVTEWVTKVLGRDMYVRQIPEFKRSDAMAYDMRDVYETYTRNVRYGTYKTLYADTYQNAHVVLGHNQDDCLENICTNISMRCKYENLSGMQAITSQDEITFFRPLLSIPKETIIQYAHEHNIPYLPNSTPEWSQRGQIRNKVVPCMEEWNAQFVPGLFALRDVLADVHQLVQQQMDAYHHKMLHVKDTDGGVMSYVLNMPKEEMPMSKLVWRGILSKCGYMTDRALTNFLERVRRFIESAAQTTKSSTKVDLHKHCTVRLEICDAVCTITIFKNHHEYASP